MSFKIYFFPKFYYIQFLSLNLNLALVFTYLCSIAGFRIARSGKIENTADMKKKTDWDSGKYRLGLGKMVYFR